MAFQLIRVIAVVTLLGAAAAIATPKGRLPLALRGVLRTLGRKDVSTAGERVPAWRRILAMVMIVAAAALALV